MSLSDNIATQVSNLVTTSPTFVANPTPFVHMIWSPDGTMIAVGADWPLDGDDDNSDWAAFVVPSAAPAGGVRLMDTPLNGGVEGDFREEGFAWLRDSSTLIVYGEFTGNGDDELFAVTDLSTQDQLPQSLRVNPAPLPTSGDIDGFSLSP